MRNLCQIEISQTAQKNDALYLDLKEHNFPEKSELMEAAQEPVDEEEEVDDEVEDIGTKSELKGNQYEIFYIFLLFSSILSH